MAKVTEVECKVGKGDLTKIFKKGQPFLSGSKKIGEVDKVWYDMNSGYTHARILLDKAEDEDGLFRPRAT